MLLAQNRDQFVLREIHVLIFVDQDVTEAVLPLRARLLVVFEEIDRANDQVIKVEAVRLGEPALILGVDVGETLAQERLVRRAIFLGPNQRVLRFADLSQACARRQLTFVVVEVGEDLADDGALIGVVDDGEIRGDARARAFAAQHAHAHRVERADPQIARLVADHALEARFHCAGGFIRERYGKYLIRRDIELIEQVCDAVREDAGLPASRTCENQTRAISISNGGRLDVV